MQMKIKNGDISFQCFYPTGTKFSSSICGENIPDKMLEEIVDEEWFSKYIRYKEIATNPRYRECPKCSEPHIGSAEHPMMSCNKCSLEFCFIHSIFFF